MCLWLKFEMTISEKVNEEAVPETYSEDSSLPSLEPAVSLPLSQPKSFLFKVKCQTLVDFRSVYFNVISFPSSKKQRLIQGIYFVCAQVNVIFGCPIRNWAREPWTTQNCKEINFWGLLASVIICDLPLRQILGKIV